MTFAAHELLETQEALRTKAAQIEQHGAFMQQCQNQNLRDILSRHQQRMMSSYQQGINLLQGRGQAITHQPPRFHAQDAQIGMQNQAEVSAPNPNSQTLSDQTIATLSLNAHKTGSVMGMVWAGECVDPQVRQYHVNSANQCQEMAYDIWNWMNQQGYYQPPAFSQNQVSQMQHAFQSQQGMPGGMQGQGYDNTGPYTQ